MKRVVVLLGLLGFVALFGSGCIVPSQEALRKADSSLQQPQTPQSQASTEGSALLKPVIPSSTEATPQPSTPPDNDSVKLEGPERMPALSTDNPFEEKPVPTAENSKPEKPLPAPIEQTAHVKQDWEDQKVREAAIEMAKASPLVRQIKICYAVKAHEWWVILYEQGDGFIELKQFIYNKESEKLDPFLVVKRIPTTRLQQHLSEEEPGKACEIVEPPSHTPAGKAVRRGPR